MPRNLHIPNSFTILGEVTSIIAMSFSGSGEIPFEPNTTPKNDFLFPD